MRTSKLPHGCRRGLVTRGASYTYTMGPDGRRYATGGEVGIDTARPNAIKKPLPGAAHPPLPLWPRPNLWARICRWPPRPSKMQMQAQMELMLQRRNAAYSRMAEETDDSTACNAAPSSTPWRKRNPAPCAPPLAQPNQTSPFFCSFFRTSCAYPGLEAF